MKSEALESSAYFERLTLLEDEPVPSFRVDELELIPFARVIAGAAVGTRGPFTIGVFADWGQGKTSVLKQAMSLIQENPEHADVVTVWFNAWQYEKEEHPIIPLTATIVGALERKAVERRGKARESVRKGWLSISHALRAVAYGFSAKLKVGVPGLGEVESGFVAKEMIERYDELRTPDDPLLDRSIYYSAFERLANISKVDGSIKGEEQSKIVVFVDDLDRCLPPQGLALLESIKLVLAQPGFIFVLAVDRRILEGYLTKRYKSEYGVSEYAQSGTSYLDKIVQLPLVLPPHRSRFKKFITKLLERETFEVESNKQIREALEGLTSLLSVGSNYNPRNLVRFVNNLIVDRSIWLSMDKEVDVQLLGLCAVSRILQQHLGDRLYRHLVRSKTLCEQLAEKAESEKNLSEWLVTGDRSPISRTGRVTRDLIAHLEQAEFLEELLTTDVGKRWLTDSEARTSVNEFLVEQRQETLEVPISQREIIDQAIREEIGKESRAAITEDERKDVKSLQLFGTDISNSGLQFLKSMEGLEILDLKGTQITDAGLDHLKALAALKHLGLGETKITDAGLEHIKELSTLKSIDLEGTRITDAGLKHLEQLEKNLEVLDLKGTQITDAGLEHLRRLTALKWLGLEGIRITDAGLKHLSPLTALEALNLRETPITSAGLKLIKSLPKLKSIDLTELSGETGA